MKSPAEAKNIFETTGPLGRATTDIFAGNVAIVQSQDSSSAVTRAIDAQAFFRFTGDTRETVQVQPLSPEPFSEGAWVQARKLFGAWVESGEEDQQLEELYRPEGGMTNDL